MALRFKGLVRQARDCRRRMLAGIAPGERDEFLASVQETVDFVDRRCRDHGIRVEDLPNPSMKAVAYLRGISETRPDHLPLPREGVKVAKPIRITNVVKDQTEFLTLLATPTVSVERLDDVFFAMSMSVKTIEDICEEDGTTPAGLPVRSRQSFLIMKWLTCRENFDHYVQQARLAHAPLKRAVLRSGGSANVPVRILFLPGRHLWNGRSNDGTYTWHLSAGFLGASAQDLHDLGEVVVKHPPPPPVILSRHKLFVSSPEFEDVLEEIHLLLEDSTFDSKGTVWDLDVLFDKLNAEFFGGSLSRPGLHWEPCTCRIRRLGRYDFVRDVVVLNPLLDDARLPEYVPTFVLFHELLHKKHGFAISGARRLMHTPQFQEDERQYPYRERAQRWIGVLSTDWDGKPPHGLPKGEPPQRAAEAGANTHARPPSDPQPVPTCKRSRIPRNRPCPCGSGRKYKKCCGK